MDLSRWKSGWAVAALSVVAVALVTFFFALRDDSTSAAPVETQLVAAQDLTRDVGIEVSQPQFDSAAGRHYVHATITNRGDKPLVGPIVVSPHDAVGLFADADGRFDSGNGYVTLVPEGKQLEPGQRIQSRRIGLKSRSDRQTADNFRVWRGLALGGSGAPSMANAVAAVSPPPVNVGGSGGGMQPIPQPPGQYPIPDQRVVNRVVALQDAWAPRLFAVRGVHGAETGLQPDGEVVLRVFVDSPQAANNLPRAIDGVRVQAAVGPQAQFRFQPPPPGKLGQGGTPAPRPDPLCTDDSQARWARPIPIGVSGTVVAAAGPANLATCSTGTIGARVRGRDGKLYALSNNHVFADFNQAPIGSPIFQPGPLDFFCTADGNNIVGHLADFEPFKPASFVIPFGNGLLFDVSNEIDAAIAEVSESTVGNSTPCSGYGLPNSSHVEPVLGMRVEKYGRTTTFQTGRVIGINATIFIGADVGNGFVEPIVFVRQIAIIHTEPNLVDFSAGGDSGSLVVTAHPDLNPVGLLFAGGPRDLPGIGDDIDVTFANRIGPVLERFNVTIDGSPTNFRPR